MLKLNCELKEKCENYGSVNCYHCVNNLDLPFINNYKEKKNDLSKSLKESFDSENLNNVTTEDIDDILMNILLQYKYKINPRSVQAMKIKELISDMNKVNSGELTYEKFEVPKPKDNKDDHVYKMYEIEDITDNADENDFIKDLKEYILLTEKSIFNK